MFKIIYSLTLLAIARTADMWLDEKHEAGFIKFNEQDDIFYWMF